MTSLFYDRNGNAINQEAWMSLFRNRSYQIVLQDNLPDGTFISTVWLGLDHGHEDLKLIFESMVFQGERESKECKRYETEKEALAGHQRLVKEYQSRVESTHSRWDHVVEESNAGTNRSADSRASKKTKRRTE